MINLVNGKIRPNTDNENKALFGWFEVLDQNAGVFYNNIKIKIKPKDETGKLRITLDFPSKTVIMQDRVEKKIFYVKPINKEAYLAFEQAALRCILENAGNKNVKVVETNRELE